MNQAYSTNSQPPSKKRKKKKNLVVCNKGEAYSVGFLLSVVLRGSLWFPSAITPSATIVTLVPPPLFNLCFRLHVEVLAADSVSPHPPHTPHTHRTLRLTHRLTHSPSPDLHQRGSFQVKPWRCVPLRVADGDQHWFQFRRNAHTLGLLIILG